MGQKMTDRFYLKTKFKLKAVVGERYSSSFSKEPTNIFIKNLQQPYTLEQGLWIQKQASPSIHAHLQDITASLPNISLSNTFTPASTTEIKDDDIQLPVFSRAASEKYYLSPGCPIWQSGSQAAVEAKQAASQIRSGIWVLRITGPSSPRGWARTLKIFQSDSKELMRKQVICVFGTVFNKGW